MNEKLTLFKHPIRWIKVCIQMKQLNRAYGGRWGDIKVHPLGTIEVRNKKLWERINELSEEKEVEE